MKKLFYISLPIILFGLWFYFYFLVGYRTKTNGAGGKSSIISFTFDDGYSSQYKAVQYLNEFGLPATCYVITRDSFNRMTNEQIVDLYIHGNEIGSHTMTHPHLTFSSGDLKEISESKKDLEKLGIKVSSFAYPYGKGNILVEKNVQKNYVNARIVGEGYNTPLTSKWRIEAKCVRRETTLAQVQNWIDEAKQKSYWLVLVFHNVSEKTDSWGCTPSMFQKVCMEVKNSHIPVLKITDAWNTYYNNK